MKIFLRRDIPFGKVMVGKFREKLEMVLSGWEERLWCWLVRSF